MSRSESWTPDQKELINAIKSALQGGMPIVDVKACVEYSINTMDDGDPWDGQWLDWEDEDES